MALLQTLRDAIFGKRIVDPLFGELAFGQALSDLGPPRKYVGYWGGMIYFEPVGYDVGIAVVGDDSGPTEDQHLLFRELISRWYSVVEKLKEAMHPVYQKWFAEDPDHRILDRDAMFASLTIESFWFEHPTLRPDRKEWQDFDVTFCVPDEVEHVLVAHVKDWSVIDVGWEG